MFQSRWRPMPLLLVTPAVAAVALGLAGCGSSPSQASGTSAVKPAGSASAAASASTATSANSAGGATAAKSAGVVDESGAYTASKLRGALLTKINGITPATAAAEGTYSSLPGTKPQKATGVTVSPQACGGDSTAGFDAAEVAGAPAASVTFKVGGNGVSEVLLSPSNAMAATVLEQQIPAECTHYTATSGGKTYHYTVTDSSLSGIGEQARVINLQTVGYPSDDIWSVLYRGKGFVGAVTVVGPNASETAVRELGSQAYGYAAKTLS